VTLRMSRIQMGCRSMSDATAQTSSMGASMTTSIR
jgi:hypothetical protein